MNLNKKKSWFFKKVYSLLNAGLKLDGILLGLSESDPALGPRIKTMRDALHRGESFVDAIQHVFHLSSTEASLLNAAQTTGDTAPALKSIVDYAEKNALFRNEVNKALLRPMITFGIAVAIFALVTTVIVPKMLANLPMKTTPLLITVLSSVGKAVPYLLGFGVTLALVALVIYIVNRLLFWRLVFALPIIGAIKMHDAIFSFFLTISLLYNGGVSIKDAMHLVAPNSNAYFASIVDDVIWSIDHGTSMSRAFEALDILPFYVIELIDTAEQTGDYGKHFREAAELAEEDFVESKNTLLPIIELGVLLTVATVIIVTLLSVLIPIQEMGQAVFTGKGV